MQCNAMQCKALFVARIAVEIHYFDDRRPRLALGTLRIIWVHRG
jgi:hypothetical protein